jgi:hypothetical protein
MLGRHYIQPLAVSLAHEDYCGLFELPATISQREPKFSEAETLQACRAAISQLLDQGVLALFRVPSGAPSPSAETAIPVPPSEVAGVLSKPEAWELPHEASSTYWLATTEAGEEAYLAGEFESL